MKNIINICITLIALLFIKFIIDTFEDSFSNNNNHTYLTVLIHISMLILTIIEWNHIWNETLGKWFIIYNVIFGCIIDLVFICVMIYFVNKYYKSQDKQTKQITQV